MVTLKEARRVIEAAERKASEIGHPMNIAVVDEGGNLVSHVRMDGAWIGSIDISINKAYTSRAFDISTKDLAQYSQIRRAVLRNTCIEPWARDDCRRRHPAEARRKSGRRRGCERRFRRAGSHRRRSWRQSIPDSQRSEHLWQAIVEWYTSVREK